MYPQKPDTEQSSISYNFSCLKILWDAQVSLSSYFAFRWHRVCQWHLLGHLFYITNRKTTLQIWNSGNTIAYLSRIFIYNIHSIWPVCALRYPSGWGTTYTVDRRHSYRWCVETYEICGLLWLYFVVVISIFLYESFAVLCICRNVVAIQLLDVALDFVIQIDLGFFMYMSFPVVVRISNAVHSVSGAQA